jgi:hypothetical protein
VNCIVVGLKMPLFAQGIFGYQDLTIKVDVSISVISFAPIAVAMSVLVVATPMLSNP